MFIDEADIQVRAGRGGAGCVSFHRAKYIAYGGPDGGDGGHGGNVIVQASPHVATLLDFKGKHHWRAKNGLPGEGGNRTGRGGVDLVIELPVGTLITDLTTGVLLKDLNAFDSNCCIARGGNGGRGNASFATATQQAPRVAEPGEPGEERDLHLELKLIADVGLVGLPNAGKSTMLARVSHARPKIAPYPFTTLTPQLGIVTLDGERRLVVADIPGLIEGAHTGAGLGDAFLRHIERTRLLVHVLDIAPIDGSSPAAAYRTIRHELTEYSAKLASKPEVVVANKIDLLADDGPVDELRRELNVPVLAVSAATGAGIGPLCEYLWAQLGDQRDEPTRAVDLPVPPHLRGENHGS